MLLKRKSSIPAPDGTYIWFIDRVEDVGIKQTRFGQKPTLKVGGQTNERDPLTSEPYRLSLMFTASIDPKSSFFKFVATVTGKEPPDGFDTGSLVGLVVEVDVKQQKKERGTFANIVGYRRLAPGVRVPVPVLMPDRATAFPGAD